MLDNLILFNTKNKIFFIFRQIIKFQALFCFCKTLISIKTQYAFQVHSFLSENDFFFECVFKKSL